MNNGVFIGRFQPVHEGHIHVVQHALTHVDKLYIILGSAYSPRTIKNPWTTEERVQMFKTVLPEEQFKRIQFVPIRDYHYNDKKWATEIRNAVGRNVHLFGHQKDHTSYYLNLFPEWQFHPVEDHKQFNASDIRKAHFDMGMLWGTPWAVQEYLSTFRQTDHYRKLREEFLTTKAYKEAWANAPFPPRFVTVDSVVRCNGHILLVERAKAPGKSLFALPGGFLEDNERLIEGAIRETLEETNLVLNTNSLKDKDVFDYPARSLRGRTITHGFFFELEQDLLPEVKGADDAAKAFWMSVPDVYRNEEKFYEDHWYIISKFIEGSI